MLVSIDGWLCCKNWRSRILVYIQYGETGHWKISLWMGMYAGTNHYNY